MAYFLVDKSLGDDALLEAALGDIPGACIDLEHKEDDLPSRFAALSGPSIKMKSLTDQAVERVRRLHALSGLFVEADDWGCIAFARALGPAQQRSRRARAAEVAAMQDLVMRLPGLRQAPDPKIWRGFLNRARMRDGSYDAPSPGRPVIAGRMTTPKVRQIKLEVPYAGYCLIEEHAIAHQRFDHALSAPIERTIVAAGDAAAVLPYDPVRGEVLLIEQFRVTLHARGAARAWPMEIIAGRIDDSGSPEDTARREALEEAGIEVRRMRKVAGYFPSPGVLADRVTVFVGEADLGDAGGVFGLDAEGEEIRTFVLKLETALAAVRAGEIDTGQALLALLWLDAHRAELDAAWSDGRYSATAG